MGRRTGSPCSAIDLFVRVEALIVIYQFCAEYSGHDRPNQSADKRSGMYDVRTRAKGEEYALGPSVNNIECRSWYLRALVVTEWDPLDSQIFKEGPDSQYFFYIS